MNLMKLNGALILNNRILMTIFLSTASVYAEMKTVQKGTGFSTETADCSKSDAEHVQTKYCKADFVIKATVKDEVPSADSSDWKIFHVSLKNQIKISGEFMNLSDESLGLIYVTPKFSRKSQIIIGQKYVLSGSIETVNGKRVMTINRCSDWIQPWSEVSHRHKSALRKSKFDRGCACQISNSLSAGPLAETTCATNFPLAAANSEFFGISDSVRQCFFTHGHCVEKLLSKGQLKCSWSLNGELRDCLGRLR